MHDSRIHYCYNLFNCFREGNVSMRKSTVSRGLGIVHWTVAILAVFTVVSTADAQTAYWRFDNDGMTSGQNPTGAGNFADEGTVYVGDFVGTLGNSSWSSDVPGATIMDPLGTSVSNSLSFYFGADSQIQIVDGR